MLRPSNKEFLAFSSATKLVSPVEDRERNLFNDTCSFDQVPSIYGNSDSIASPHEVSRPLQRFVEPSISLPALKTEQDSKRLNDIACAQDEHQGHPFNAKLLIAQALDESKIPLLAEMHKGHIAYPDLDITPGIRNIDDANQLISGSAQETHHMLDGLVEQPTTITGANGKVLEKCKIYWQQNHTDGMFTFKNLILPKKR